MWICLTDSFLSAVADKNDPKMLMVRARRRQDLVTVFGEAGAIIETSENADYRWRTFVDRQTFKEVLDRRVDGLMYRNFKSEVQDRDLHDMYLDFWERHRRLKCEDRSSATHKAAVRKDRSGHFTWGPGEVVHMPKKPE
jgi:hypothetical protein